MRIRRRANILPGASGEPGEGPMQTYRAIWNGVVIAESRATIVVDGYRYFPAADVDDEHLVPSPHHSACGWKGQASYYDVTAGGATDRNGAWCYPDPKPAAGMVVGYIGFWHGVRIETADEPDERLRTAEREG